MAQQTLENGISGLDFRTRLNSNFTELYGKANHCLGHYDTLAELQAAYPTANAGDWAIVTNPSAPAKPLIYLWDVETTAWIVSGTSVFVSSVFSRTGDVSAQVGDYSAFYDALGAATSAISAHNLAFVHSDIALNTAARHAVATAGTGISIIGQAITNSDTGSGAVSSHNLAFTHSDIALNTGARHARSHALNSGSDHSGLLALSQIASIPARSVLANSTTSEQPVSTLSFANVVTYAMGDVVEKSTPDDNDVFPLQDNQAAGALKTIRWASLKTRFGALYDANGAASSGDSAHLLAYTHSDIALNTGARHARSHALDSGSDHSGSLALSQIAAIAQLTILGLGATPGGVDGTPVALTAAGARAVLNVADGANNYSLPTATASVLGGIKVGARLSITDGVLSAGEQVPSPSLIYPAGYSQTYIAATLDASCTYMAYNAFNPANSLTGSRSNGWFCQGSGAPPIRVNIDMSSMRLLAGFYYENYHDSGEATSTGFRAFTLYGSNTVGDFNDTSYASVGNWVQLTTDITEFARHPETNTVDPHYGVVSAAGQYRYYSFKFSSNWGSGSSFGLRRLSLQSVVYYTHPNHSGDVTSAGDGAQTITNEAVTLAKMAKMNTASLLGNFTTGIGTTSLPTEIDAATLRGNSEYMPVSRISVFPLAHDTNHVKATSYKTGSEPSYVPWKVTDPANPLTGAIENQWLSDTSIITNQRFHVDLDTAQTIVGFYYENGHNSGTQVGSGVKTFTLWGSNDAGAFGTLTYGTDTNWTQLSTDATMFMPHVAANRSDPRYVSVIGAGSYRYYAFKFADTWGSTSGFMYLRRIEFRVADPVVDGINLGTAMALNA